MSVGNVGEAIPLRIKQGATFSVPATIRNSDGTAVNLAGATLLGVLKKRWDSVAYVAFSISVVDVANGGIVITLSAGQTNNLECGETEQDSKSRYVYEIKLTESNGVVSPLCYGAATVFRELKI